jgi:ubiquinone/menaquinone biosynthesis C-methylase UbiE
MADHGGCAVADPRVPDWLSLELPDTWPDRLDLRRPRHLWQFLRCIAGKRQRVRLPDDLPGLDALPKYVLQEFHNLPNGNYSKKVTRGYITGFDRVMLGQMRRARGRLAGFLRGCRSALDVGCAGGRTAQALKASGIPEVWGIDPSPYLLQHAARDFPDISFVQGVAERTGFGAGRFDGIAACFLLHELPPRYLEQALTEFHRILVPGGRLAICEPSPLHLRSNLWTIWRRDGWRGLYFHVLARNLHEPFLDAWHKRDVEGMFRRFGFELVADEQQVPFRYLFARKC